VMMIFLFMRTARRLNKILRVLHRPRLRKLRESIFHRDIAL
jgi:hypothetical protein